MSLTAHTIWLAIALAGAVAVWWWARRWRRDVAALCRQVGNVADGGGGVPPERPAGALGELHGALRRAFAQQAARVDAARLQLRRLQAVLEGMVEGVLVIDAQGTVLLSNRGAEELLDLPHGEDYTGRSLIELTRHPDLHRLLRWVGSEAALEHDSTIEIGMGGTGTYVLQVTVTPVDAGPDAGRAYILVFHDITALKRLERMRRDFVANVSHELRTPLAAIAGYTETLLGGALDDHQRAKHFLQIIERHTDRLGRLVNDLLTLSDLELGRTELHRTALSAERVIDAAFEVLRGKAAQHGVALEKHVEDDVPSCDADQDRLEQAILNLVDNAIKYTPRGGSVSVRVRVLPGAEVPEVLRRADAPRFCEIAVEDTGIGVPAEDLPRLTERFYRVDKARSHELGGTGLGLAIVKHIVQAHGGAMRIESQLHHGTTVRLVLPAHSARSENVPAAVRAAS
ncbi:MAG: ATP-binding protein [Candidatus Binatia bacterium]